MYCLQTNDDSSENCSSIVRINVCKSRWTLIYYCDNTVVYSAHKTLRLGLVLYYQTLAFSQLPFRWTVTLPTQLPHEPAPLFHFSRLVFVLTFLRLQRDIPWFGVFFCQTLPKVALSFCLPSASEGCYTADPHAAFCHSVIEENIWGVSQTFLFLFFVSQFVPSSF